MIKIYGMPSCPDCTYLDEQIKGNDNFVKIDIGAKSMHLKEFLLIRDTSDVFDSIKGTGAIGIPCFVLEDGTVTLTAEDVGKNVRSREMEKHRIFTTSFAKIYPLLVQKAERKNRTQEEVDEIICWLTGYDIKGLKEQLGKEVDYETFFEQAPYMNPDAELIKGVVCGIRVEEIEDLLMKKIRYLDKLIDELAKGKPMEKILRRNAKA